MGEPASHKARRSAPTVMKQGFVIAFAVLALPLRASWPMWLDSPDGRSNPQDPKNLGFKLPAWSIPPAQTPLVSATPSQTRTPSASSTPQDSPSSTPLDTPGDSATQTASTTPALT